MNSYRKPISIKPREVVKEKSRLSDSLVTLFNFLYLFLRTVFVSAFLTIISSIIGLYSFRIYENLPLNFIQIMDLVFKSPLPSLDTIVIVIATTWLFSVIYYGEYIRSQMLNIAERISGFSKLLASFIVVLWIDIQVFHIDFYRLFYKNVLPHNLDETVFSQIFSILLILFFTGIFKALIKLIPVSYEVPDRIKKNLKRINQFRFLALSCLMVFSTTYLVTIDAPIQESVSIYNIPLPLLHVGVFLGSLGIISVFYRPPKSLGELPTYLLLRLLIGFLCFFGIGYLYSFFPDSEMYLFYVAVSGLITILSYPFFALLC